VSCNITSKLPLANITPVNPPTVNKNKKPMAHNNGTSKFNLPPHNVATHEKIFIPVGTAIIIVAAVK
jgi:hypothetical protein